MFLPLRCFMIWSYSLNANLEVAASNRSSTVLPFVRGLVRARFEHMIKAITVAIRAFLIKRLLCIVAVPSDLAGRR